MHLWKVKKINVSFKRAQEKKFLCIEWTQLGMLIHFRCNNHNYNIYIADR